MRDGARERREAAERKLQRERDIVGENNLV